MDSIRKKRYSIDSDFTVTEFRLMPCGIKGEETVFKQVETKYKSKSLLESECIIRLLKYGVSIKQ